MGYTEDEEHSLEMNGSEDIINLLKNWVHQVVIFNRLTSPY